MITPVADSRPSLLIVETGVTLIAAALALGWPRAGAGTMSALEKWLGRLARRRAAAVATVGVAALGIRLAILPFSPVPQPFIHDEFANLLAADTFASGRLTNPTHPLWKHFESFHITQKPTYMSMYFPAQGLVMAAGKALAGNAWFGVWLSAGLMCSAICWMLYGWLPPGWALAGGLLAVMRLGLFSYWMDDYHGGAVAAVGGALVLGALPRLIRHARVRDGMWMALGMVLLANSRPYEGVLVSAPAVGYLLYRVAGQERYSLPLLLRRALLPAALLLAAAAMSAYYNQRVFGNALTLPYQVNRATYASAPVFLWQRPRPEPVYRHAVMRDFYTNWELRDFLRARTPGGFLLNTAQKAGIVLFFFFGMALFPPLVMLPGAFGDRRIRFLLAAGAIYAAGLSMNAWLFPHYFAPFACAVYVIFLQCARHLRAWRPEGQPRGLAVVRAIPVLCLVLAAVRLFAGPLGVHITRWPTMWYGTEPMGLARAEVLRNLERRPGAQLAIVRYAANHEPFDDWVYNAADIDHSRVVWARQMGPVEDRELVRYFADRVVWLVEPDAVPPRVSPYAADAGNTMAAGN